MAKSYHKELSFRKAHPPHYYQCAPTDRGGAAIHNTNSMVGGVGFSPYSAIIYPNGEFGIGYIGRESKSALEKKFDRGIVGNIKVEDIPREHELEDGTILSDIGDKQAVPFILDSPNESSQTKRYGLRGITSLGKKMVRNGCYLLEKRLKRYGEYTQFSTVTLPNMGAEYEKYICANWSQLVRKFFQELRRVYKNHGRTFHYVAVTEIQPKRWQEYRFTGLHLHFVYNAIKLPAPVSWVITDTFVRDVWVRILNNALNTASTLLGLPPLGVDWVSYRREPVKKSAENYLGKYMTKGGKIIQEVLEEKGEEYLPKQWWSISNFLRYTIKKLTVRSRTEEVVEYILEAIRNKDEGILYWFEARETRPILNVRGDIWFDDFRYGYGGKMSVRLLRECKLLWRTIRQHLTGDCVAS